VHATSYVKGREVGTLSKEKIQALNARRGLYARPPPRSRLDRLKQRWGARPA
jgi:hypothetical protein